MNNFITYNFKLTTITCKNTVPGLSCPRFVITAIKILTLCNSDIIFMHLKFVDL